MKDLRKNMVRMNHPNNEEEIILNVAEYCRVSMDELHQALSFALMSMESRNNRIMEDYDCQKKIKDGFER